EAAKTAKERRAAAKFAAIEKRRKQAEARQNDGASQSTVETATAPPNPTDEQAEQQTDVSAKRVARRERDCPQAGEDIQVPGWYVVKQGDTLWTIAEQYYRRGSRYRLIRKANARRITSARRIYPCQRIYLPKILRRA
ncbi:MAG: LysM peptidoglycan-binding domain-containing protein, partial [Bacteroidota bacterium]